MTTGQKLLAHNPLDTPAAEGTRNPVRFAKADTLDDRRQAAALYQDGLLAFWQGADEEACSLHGRSLHLARRAGDRTLIALALCGLARVALHEDLDWARTLCEEALATVNGTDNPTARADALHVLSVAARMQGDLRQARHLAGGRDGGAG